MPSKRPVNPYAAEQPTKRRQALAPSTGNEAPSTVNPYEKRPSPSAVTHWKSRPTPISDQLSDGPYSSSRRKVSPNIATVRPSSGSLPHTSANATPPQNYGEGRRLSFCPEGENQARFTPPSTEVLKDETYLKKQQDGPASKSLVDILGEHSVEDYLIANYGQRGEKRKLWKSLCDSAGIALPTCQVKAKCETVQDHFDFRKALVLEETRETLCQSLGRIWAKHQLANGAIQWKHDSQIDHGHRVNVQCNGAQSAITIFHVELGERRKLSKVQKSTLMPGSVVLGILAGCPTVQTSFMCYIRQRKELNLECKLMSGTRGVSQEELTGLFTLVPLDLSIHSSREFDACCRLSTMNGTSLALMSALLGNGNAKSSAELSGSQPDDTSSTNPQATVEEADPAREAFRLNESQEKAVQSFLSSSVGSISIVQGPPGTGKTTLLQAVIYRYISSPNSRGRLLVCAHTNKAVMVLAKRVYSLLSPSSWKPEGYNMIVVGNEAKLFDKPDDSKKEDYMNPMMEVSLKSWMSSMIRNFSGLEGYLSGDLKLPECAGSVEELVKRLKGRLTRSLRHLPKSLMTLLEQLEAAVSPDGSRCLAYDSTREVVSGILTELRQMCSEWQTIGIIHQELLESADVIFSTLSGAASLNLGANSTVEALIVDEAACATEPSLYIPLRHMPKRLLLVGDPKQLPATVISDQAKNFGYDESLQQRLMDRCGYQYTLLDEQFRMDPEISLMPNDRYYAGRVKNGENVKNPSFGEGTWKPDGKPYTFVEVDCAQEAHQQSIRNVGEANAVALTLRNVMRHHSSEKGWDRPERVRVITFYKAQVALLKMLLKGTPAENVTVGTVDSSQGCESDVVILSFVRSRGNTAGFLRDDRRLNVAMTRARHTLVCVGYARHLATLPGCFDESVRKLLSDAFQRRLIYKQP